MFIGERTSRVTAALHSLATLSDVGSVKVPLVVATQCFAVAGPNDQRAGVISIRSSPGT